ncbi:MAG: hypothetical protein Q4F97_11670 [Bacteroidales bacterium]|nr:hypothetical protein [Bacteroidales bacterium]
MDKKLFFEYIKFPENLNSISLKVLEEILNDYPYFQTARFLYLQNLSRVNSLRFSDELKKSAPFLPDRKQLFIVLGNKEYEWSELLEMEREKHRRNSEVGNSKINDNFSLVDAFLDSVSDKSYAEELEDIIRNQLNYPSDDYASSLLSIPNINNDKDDTSEKLVNDEDKDSMSESDFILNDASHIIIRTKNDDNVETSELNISINNGNDKSLVGNIGDKSKETVDIADNNISSKDKLAQQQSLIDSFIEKDSKEQLFIPSTDSVPDAVKTTSKDDSLIKEDAFLTESLAKIYIKQKKYNKALEIIKKLSLKYPEKNIYFADQIRFLEKIIINIKTE